MWAEAQKGKAFFVTSENHDCLPGEFHLGLRNEAVMEQYQWLLLRRTVCVLRALCGFHLWAAFPTKISCHLDFTNLFF
jgi:uncharacterized protein (DUF169 family)